VTIFLKIFSFGFYCDLEVPEMDDFFLGAFDDYLLGLN